MSTFFQSLLGSFMAPKVLLALGGVLALILADFILGVLLSFKNGTFDAKKLAQFMETSFVPYIGGLLILALFSSTDPALEVLFFTISAAVYAKFLADIKDKFSQLFAGISIQATTTVQPQNGTSQPVLADSGVVAPIPEIVVSTDTSTTPKSITEVIQDTFDKVGEEAKAKEQANFTDKLMTVVQEASAPAVPPVV